MPASTPSVQPACSPPQTSTHRKYIPENTAARASFRPAARRQASREKQKQAVCGGLGTLPRSNTSPQAAPTASASGPAAASTQIAAAGITASGTPNGSCTRTSPASRHTAAAYGRSRAFAGADESMRTLSVSKTSRKMSCSAACSPPSARRTKMTPSSA